MPTEHDLITYQELHCPGCGAHLIDCLGATKDDLYDAVKCPNECDLWEYY